MRGGLGSGRLRAERSVSIRIADGSEWTTMCKIVKDAVIPMMDSQVSEGKEKRDVIPGKDNVAGGVEWSVSIPLEVEYVAKVLPRF
jgi:hypothetical protein